ncbi:MAG: metal-dependent hydrolase [Actinomycetia bacterium]|nr:metal-dependent hydrolase [Actinomycetes bacterium]
MAAKEVDDPSLRADMKALSGQEARHYKNQARVNDIVRDRLSDHAAAAMRDLENQLDADYR